MSRIINEKTKQIATDMLINIAGTAIPLIVLQLIIYPIVAKKIDAESYGQMQSIMSVIYLVGGTLGGALSTTRLVKDYEYREKNIFADFNYLFIIALVITTVLVPIVVNVVFKIKSLPEQLLILSIAILNYSVNYLQVGFRLKLNYKAIFFCKVLNCVGYLAGFGAFILSLKWQWIFIFSLLFEAIFSIVKTDLLKEPYAKSNMMKATVKSFSDYSIANLLTKALTYFDKLLLYPLLGGAAVSVYFAANVFGKLILQAMEPITNVILSYLSKTKRVSKRTWKYVIPISATVCTLLYLLCILVSKPVLNIFYPQWASAAIKLVPISTLSLALSAFISIIYPFSLKNLESHKQIIINLVGVVIYISAALILYKKFELLGCCVALLLSYFFKMLVMLYLCLKGNKNEVE